MTPTLACRGKNFAAGPGADSAPNGPNGRRAVAALPVVAIIVSHDRRAELDRCLASLAQLDPPIARILVVDNASTDGTAAMVRQSHPGVILHAAASNLGPCVARNLGVDLVADGAAEERAILWFLDSDTLASRPDAAWQMYRLFEQDPALGAVGGEAVLDACGASIGVKRLSVTANGFVQGQLLRDRVPTRYDGTVIASCNLMIRRSDFCALGGFDPFYFFFYEDMDLTWRLHRLGRRAAVLSPMPVLHLFSQTARVNRLWLHARNRMYFCIKTLPAWRVLLLPVLDLAFLLQIENIRRLLRRARQSGPAVALVTEDNSAERGVSLRRAGLLLARVGGMILLGYVALPGVLWPALKGRRSRAGHAPARTAVAAGG
jgi:hypothetical protein